ncbi:RNA polymerase, sigma-24 subunit, ECF subfamily [Paenibacillus curdlanolyticus YK9]|uniref:RNA polymerase, sigma-24 subunit, ECF subfamily n=1 Tax=Paenibacillus curdlanolyticus YK9 TaxID=717606 RepID=E0I6I6_9BACL|nr:RNA polymerase sigma factor [Paenibacillus curdlanolyticus]EFM11652.1 RNA polymerase, sigma-24 subunit, ECF subfamily [Paenibacillus curdlanolyticus YK9]
MTDDELVQGMARGEQACFEAFVQRHHAPLSGYLQRQLRDAQKAEDFVQETFLRFLRQLKERSIPDNAQAWLYRVALNLCRDYWKSAQYHTDNRLMAEMPEQRDMQTSVVELAERQETRQEIIRSLDELPDVQKQVVMLRFFQDLKLQDIAEALQLPLGSVKTHLYKGLRKLKDRLKPDKEETHTSRGGKQHEHAKR